MTKYEDKCGFRTISTCSLKFDNVRVPAANLVGEEGKGYIYAMKTLDKSRACVGALAVGIARRAPGRGAGLREGESDLRRPRGQAPGASSG